MNKSTERKISMVLFVAAIVLFCASAVTGLIVDRSATTIDTVFMFAGFACLGFGFVLQSRSKDNGDDIDK